MTLCIVGALLSACGNATAEHRAAAPTAARSSRGSVCGRLGPRMPIEDASKWLVAVDFTSLTLGVGLVGGDCGQPGPVEMVVSHDGGSSWTATRGVLWRHAPPFLERLVATSPRHVWASQPDGSLLETYDGGRRWQIQPVPTPVDQLARAGGSVWALSCPAVNEQADVCTPVVEQQSVDGGPWRQLSLPVGSVHGVPALDVVTPSTAVVLANVVGVPVASEGRLVVTTDAGRSWTAQAVPRGPGSWCTGGAGTTFVAGNAATWWLWCNGPGAASSSVKALLRSTDSGRMWTTVSEVPSLQALPVSRSLTRADTSNVAAASPRLLWAASANVLTESTDGGRQWRHVPAVHLRSGDLASFDTWSPTRSWLLDPGSGLWSTTDGTTWHRLAPPVAPARCSLRRP